MPEVYDTLTISSKCCGWELLTNAHVSPPAVQLHPVAAFAFMPILISAFSLWSRRLPSSPLLHVLLIGTQLLPGGLTLQMPMFATLKITPVAFGLWVLIRISLNVHAGVSWFCVC